MVYAKSFEIFKTLLSTIKESNLPYKILGNYGNYKPAVQLGNTHYENSRIKCNFLIISPMLTFVYKDSINYSDDRFNEIKSYFEKLDLIETKIHFDTDITLR